MPQEHHLTIPRTARYYALGESARAPTEIWMVCHGYGQLAGRFLSRLDALDDGRRLIVAPEGLSRFYVDGTGPASKVGASWMTREDRETEIDDYVRYLDAVFDAACRPADRNAAALTVFGFSQGTATASRWAVRGQRKVERLILCGITPRPDQGGRQQRGIAKTALGAELSVPWQYEAGVRHRLISFEGGHRIDADALRRLVTP